MITSEENIQLNTSIQLTEATIPELRNFLNTTDDTHSQIELLH